MTPSKISPLAPAACTPACEVPPLPTVLADLLLRYYHERHYQAGQVQVDRGMDSGDNWLRPGHPLSAPAATALLDYYGAPASDVDQAHALLTSPEHQHELTGFVLAGAWLDALKSRARSAVIYYRGGPLPEMLPPAAQPRDRSRPVPAGGCQVTLLLQESVLEEPYGGHAAAAARLTHIARLAEAGAITLHLVPGLPTPSKGASLLTWWTPAGDTPGGRAGPRSRLYVTHAPNAIAAVRNGPAAAAERRLLREAVGRAMPSPWSTHQVWRAVWDHQTLATETRRPAGRAHAARQSRTNP
ncbi:Scr1 family TA system antitoxin-like transcriptional regulator [Streptomyces goshikiensis]